MYRGMTPSFTCNYLQKTTTISSIPLQSVVWTTHNVPSGLSYGPHHSTHWNTFIHTKLHECCIYLPHHVVRWAKHFHYVRHHKIIFVMRHSRGCISWGNPTWRHLLSHHVTRKSTFWHLLTWWRRRDGRWNVSSTRRPYIVPSCPIIRQW